MNREVENERRRDEWRGDRRRKERRGRGEGEKKREVDRKRDRGKRTVLVCCVRYILLYIV